MWTKSTSNLRTKYTLRFEVQVATETEYFVVLSMKNLFLIYNVKNICRDNRYCTWRTFSHPESVSVQPEFPVYSSCMRTWNIMIVKPNMYRTLSFTLGSTTETFIIIFINLAAEPILKQNPWQFVRSQNVSVLHTAQRNKTKNEIYFNFLINNKRCMKIY